MPTLRHAGTVDAIEQGGSMTMAGEPRSAGRPNIVVGNDLEAPAIEPIAVSGRLDDDNIS